MHRKNWRRRRADKAAASQTARYPVIANFGTVVKGSDLRLHPMVAGLVGEQLQAKMRNSPMQKAEV